MEKSGVVLFLDRRFRWLRYLRLRVSRGTDIDSACGGYWRLSNLWVMQPPSKEGNWFFRLISDEPCCIHLVIYILSVKNGICTSMYGCHLEGSFISCTLNGCKTRLFYRFGLRNFHSSEASTYQSWLQNPAALFLLEHTRRLRIWVTQKSHN